MNLLKEGTKRAQHIVNDSDRIFALASGRRSSSVGI